MTALVLGVLALLALLRALVLTAGMAAGFWAAALTTGGTLLLGALVLRPSPAAAGGFLLASLAVLALVRWRELAAARLGFGLLLSLLVTLNPLLGVAPFGRFRPLEFLWAPQGGLLNANPLLWAGGLGLIALAYRDRLGRSLLGAVAAMILLGACQQGAGSGAPASNAAVAPLLAPLAVGLAEALRQLSGWARRRPGGLLFLGTAALGLGNLLFMEQYRRELIPRDDTVSFPRVAQNSAALLAQAVGSPLAWPANWFFAWRYRLPVDRYDEMAGRRLFPKDRAFAVIDVGDRGDEAGALAEGWSVRHPCGPQVCRQVEGRARLFAGLEERESISLGLRAQGRGALGVVVNQRLAGSVILGVGLEERRLLVPAVFWRRDLNQIVLTADPGGEAQVDRVSFERTSP
ncbi:MAG TPA: hypothetical protein VJU18_17240 [Vicinamibacteria bacterium]|nr:hypothetical protein [Vicinamibacteria bacterium]